MNIEHPLGTRPCALCVREGWWRPRMWCGAGRNFPHLPQTSWTLHSALPHCHPTFSQPISLAALFRQTESINMNSLNFLPTHYKLPLSALPPPQPYHYPQGHLLPLPRLIIPPCSSVRAVLKLLNPKECSLFLLFVYVLG